MSFAFAVPIRPVVRNWRSGLAGIALLLSTTLAAPAQLSNITFGTQVSNNQVTITDFNATGSGPLTIPATINGLPVVAIGTSYSTGEGAFYLHTELTAVTIPDSVTSLADASFEGCTQLASVTFGSGLTTIGSSVFGNCTSLTSLTIPNSVTFINEEAFNGCTHLASITLSNQISELSYATFGYCTSLSSVTIPTGVTFIGPSAFQGCTSLTSVVIPNTVTDIGQGAFESCTALASVTLPSSLVNLEYEAFQNCTALTSVTIPAGVTAIGNCPFIGCTKLSGITVAAQNPNYSSVAGVLFDKAQATLLEYPGAGATSYAVPNSVTGFGYQAFYGCANLTSVTLDNNVTSLATGTFAGTGLSSINFPPSLTTIGSDAFQGCGNLTHITIPSTVTKIYQEAFMGTGLTSVTIPGSVGFIYPFAFANCPQLSNVVISSGTTQIGQSAFSGDNMNTITIPASVTEIDFEAFYETALTSIVFRGNAPSMGQDALPPQVTAYYYDGATGFTSPTWTYYRFTFGQIAYSSCAAASLGTYSPAPSFINANNATFSVDTLTTFTVTAEATPAATFTVSGLPSWAQFNPATGVLSGNPPDTLGAPYTITFTAANGTAPNATQTFTLKVTEDISTWAGAHSFVGGTTDTPLGDATPVLLKYLCNINPSAPMSVADRAALPKLGMDTTTTPGTTYLTLTYRQFVGLTGMNVEVETSSDLETWDAPALTTSPPVAFTYTQRQIGTDAVSHDPIMQIEVPMTSDTEFLRLNVTPSVLGFF